MHGEAYHPKNFCQSFIWQRSFRDFSSMDEKYSSSINAIDWDNVSITINNAHTVVGHKFKF